MIKIVEHEVSGETKVMGFDHQPYSSNSCGAPKEVADAVFAGFAFNVTDFDLRNIEWRNSLV